MTLQDGLVLCHHLQEQEALLNRPAPTGEELVLSEVGKGERVEELLEISEIAGARTVSGKLLQVEAVACPDIKGPDPLPEPKRGHSR